MICVNLTENSIELLFSQFAVEANVELVPQLGFETVAISGAAQLWHFTGDVVGVQVTFKQVFYKLLHHYLVILINFIFFIFFIYFIFL